MTIIIRKVKEEGGCWSNMAAFPIEACGKVWRTTEALFQALRFEDEEIQELIRAEKSPMKAKHVAKARIEQMVVPPMSEKDIDNMRTCLALKIAQHPELRKKLLETGTELIVEDCTKRQGGSGLFWGAALIDGVWQGKNMLGTLWMELRDELR